MQFSDTWRIEDHHSDKGLAAIQPGAGVLLGAPDHWMPRHVAEQIIEAHNRLEEDKAMSVFREKIMNSVMDGLRAVLDMDDKKTGQNYWHLALMMRDSAVGILEAASQGQYHLVETKPDSAF